MPGRRINHHRRMILIFLLCLWSLTVTWYLRFALKDPSPSPRISPKQSEDDLFDGFSEWSEETTVDNSMVDLSFLRDIISENLFSGFAADGLYSLFESTQPTVPRRKKMKPGFDYGRERDSDMEGVSDYVMWYENFHTDSIHLPTLPRQQKCKTPVQNIAFLKTHYTGSDIITNILNRYGDLNNLHVALPSDGLSTFYWPMRFQWKYIDITLLNGSLPNIIANHARYNNDVMDNILNPGSVYITILRDPVTQLDTTFNNLHFKELLLINETDPLEAFLKDPKFYIQGVIRRKQFKDTLNLIKNGQFFDLGLATTEYHRKNIITASIQELYEKFSVVLIYEHLDESLVLMKRRLCWGLDDILYLKFHYQNQNLENREEYSDELSEMIRTWNSADTALYNFFNKTLWEEIGYEGNDFWSEVYEFKNALNSIGKDCPGLATESATTAERKVQQYGTDGTTEHLSRSKETTDAGLSQANQPVQEQRKNINQQHNLHYQQLIRLRHQYINRKNITLANSKQAVIADPTETLHHHSTTYLKPMTPNPFHLHPDEYIELQGKSKQHSKHPTHQPQHTKYSTSENPGQLIKNRMLEEHNKLSLESSGVDVYQKPLSNNWKQSTNMLDDHQKDSTVITSSTSLHTEMNEEDRQNVREIDTPPARSNYESHGNTTASQEQVSRDIEDIQPSRYRQITFHTSQTSTKQQHKKEHQERVTEKIHTLESRHSTLQINKTENMTTEERTAPDLSENNVPNRTMPTQKFQRNLTTNFDSKSKAEDIDTAEYGSGYVPVPPEINTFHQHITRMMQSQVSTWNRYLCKKLATQEAEYLDYFRRKHTYAKLALRK